MGAKASTATTGSGATLPSGGADSDTRSRALSTSADSVYCDSSRETNMKLRRETADIKSIMKSKKKKSENEKEEVSQEEIVENVSLADDDDHIISKQKKKKRKTAEEEDEGNSMKETHSESPKRKRRRKKKKRVKMALEDSASVDENETEEKIVEEETTLRVRPLSNTDEAVAERKKLKAEKKLLRNVQKEDTKATNALEYLNAWKNDRSNWKFKKALQIFLINNCLDSNRVPDSHFPPLLDYFENLQGNARNIARDSALLAISIREPPSPSNDDHSSDKVIERAKQIVSLLQS